jgi:uncharacterized repeat protein (TIGR03803 family)
MKRNRLAIISGVCGVAALLASCDRGRFEGDFFVLPPPPPVSAADGESPDGLIQGSDGNFYGTTQGGGKYGQGTVFSLTPAGAQTVLYSFAGGPGDGAAPQGLIQGGDGNLYGTTSGGGQGSCGAQPVAGNASPQAGCGTVFQVTLGGTESILYFFSGGSDGGAPNPSLVAVANGDLYGSASAGGAGRNGVVFQLTLAGVETVLHSFAGTASDGALPGGLVLGTDGNLYGVTSRGGASNNGTVFHLTPAGVETLLYSFAAGSDGAGPSAPLVEGTDGNFYGTTPFGGLNPNPGPGCQHGCGTVFKVTPAGVETVLYAFAGGRADGANPYAALIQGSDGNFYGTTSSGGNSGCLQGCGTAFSITPAGIETVLHFFGATSSDGIEPSTALIQTSDGDFYGTTPSGGQFNLGTVFTMTPAGVETVLYFFGTNTGP